MNGFDLKDSGVIRFTSAPRGGAPIEIREQWIGIEVQCLFSYDGVKRENESLHDVVSGLSIPDYPGYVVFQTQAIEALEKKSPEAAIFWKEIGFPQGLFALFLFNLESAEVVKPVMTRAEFEKNFSDE